MIHPPRSPLAAFVRAFWILLQNPVALGLEAGLGLGGLAAFLLPAWAGYHLVARSLGPGETHWSWWNAAVHAVAVGAYGDKSLSPLWWAFLVLLVTGTLAFLLACWVKAAVVGAVSEADGSVLADLAPRAEFRIPPARFFHHARAWFWPVFWLLNLYAAAISIFVGIFFIALGWLALGILSHSWVPGAIAVVLSGLLLAGAGLLLRLVTLAATWRIVRFGDGVLESVRNGWSRLASSGWHTAAAWGLVIALGMVISAILSIPRAVVQFFIDDLFRQIPLLLFWLGLSVVLQILASAVFEVLQAAALVSVWNGRSAPPVGFVNQMSQAPEAPAPVAADESLPFPEAALPPAGDSQEQD